MSEQKKDYLIFLYRLIKDFEKFVIKIDLTARLKYPEDPVIKERYMIDLGVLRHLVEEYKLLEKKKELK
jgi:hypothetical protein